MAINWWKPTVWGKRSVGPTFRFETSTRSYGGGWLITHFGGVYPPPGAMVECSRGRTYKVQREGNLVRVYPKPRQVEV